MDISETLAPASDQIDNIELASGPRIVTITSVTRGNADQPINIHVAEFDRPWRPGKTVRRIIAQAWGTDSTVYTGRRAEIYRDPEVTYGRDKTGGIRISRMSDLPDGKPLEVTLMVRRGQYQKFKITPLPDSPAPTLVASPEPTLAEINATTDVDDLRAMWSRATTDKTKALITARKDELTATAETARAAVQDALAGTEAE